jgi:hypothetical protein
MGAIPREFFLMLKSISFVIVFFVSALAFIGFGVYMLAMIDYRLSFLPAVLWVMMAFGSRYVLSVLTSVDQLWQVIASPVLNLWQHKYRFGNPDETASSVIGKNLRSGNGLEYRIIEFVLSWLFEFGKPHSIKAIEDDEP